MCVLSGLVVVWLFVTLWTVARQAPESWNFPGKNTGVGCHFLLQGIFSAQKANPHLLHWQADSLPMSHQESLSRTLCYPMDCSPPGSSVHGISQARVLEWVAISSTRGSSQPRDQTQVSHIAGRHFTIWAIREASITSPKFRRMAVGWIKLFYQFPIASVTY